MYFIADPEFRTTLQLNTPRSKTHVVLCSSHRRQHQIPDKPLMVDTDAGTPVRIVRNLGIYMDSYVSTRTHVAKTVSSCFFSSATDRFAAYDDQ